MNVVLEGPDGGGKSTLAAYLARELDMRLQQGSGPPKAPGEIERRARQYRDMRDTIFDRHPCVSQLIYGRMRGDVPSAELTRLAGEFYTDDNLIIYCRSVDDSRHVVKPGEDPAHIVALTSNYHQLVAAYDAWALEHAHIVYRIGDDQSLIRDIVRVTAC